MKIVYISGIKFGYELLEIIFERGFNDITVFSYDDSKKSIYSDYYSFDEICKKQGIKNIKVQNINDKKNVDILKNLKPDIILVMGWSQLIKPEIIKIPKLGVIGSHPTELPKYRGRAPIPWSIIKGLNESALTFFFIEKGIDNGDILDQRKFKINSNENATTLYQKITELGKSMIVDNLNLLTSGKSNRINQDNSKFVEYWEKRTPNDGEINWKKSAKEIDTLIRASTHPYPGAFTYVAKSKLKIFSSEIIDEVISAPAKILQFDESGVIIGTGKGSIKITRVQIDEKPETFAIKLFSKKDVGKVLEVNEFSFNEL